MVHPTLLYYQGEIGVDTLVIELVQTAPIRRGLVNMKGTAYVNGQVASEATMLAQIVKEK